MNTEVQKKKWKKRFHKVIVLIVFLFSLLSLFMAVDKYRHGYDEVYATITETYESTGQFIRHPSYNMEWEAADGSRARSGNIVNRLNYKEGDIILIRVDKENHKTRYNDLIPDMCVDILMMILSVFIYIKMGKNVASFDKKDEKRI